MPATEEDALTRLNVAPDSFAEEIQVRAAEASAAAQAAELLGEELQASIASSDLADLRSLAARNDVELDEVVLGADPQV